MVAARLKRLFTEHPASAGESYFQHMRVALSFALPLTKAAIAAYLHAFLPFLHPRTASDTVKQLNDRMTRRCGACSSAHLHRPASASATATTKPASEPVSG